jgi:hypothetical protein
MGNSRKIVNRLQRIAKAETETALAPVETTQEPQPGSGPRHAALQPEELITLRTIVLREQLLPFRPEAPPPPDHSRPEKSATRGSRQASPSAEPQDSPSPAPEAPEPVRKDYNMSNIETILKEAMQIDGAIGVALVDYTSGMTLGQAGGTSLNLDVAAAGNTEVVRAKLRTMEALGLHDGIEDILITLSTQYHVIRLLSDKSGIGLFLYLALDKNKANLALARHKLANLESQLEI